ILVALFKTPTPARLAAAFAALLALMIFIGRAASYLTPDGDTFARVAPGAGFWMMLFAFALLAADALTRQRLAPLIRIAILAAVAAAIGLILWLGTWNDLSILKEYA